MLAASLRHSNYVPPIYSYFVPAGRISVFQKRIASIKIWKEIRSMPKFPGKWKCRFHLPRMAHVIIAFRHLSYYNSWCQRRSSWFGWIQSKVPLSIESGIPFSINFLREDRKDFRLDSRYAQTKVCQLIDFTLFSRLGGCSVYPTVSKSAVSIGT